MSPMGRWNNSLLKYTHWLGIWALLYASVFYAPWGFVSVKTTTHFLLRLDACGHTVCCAFEVSHKPLGPRCIHASWRDFILFFCGRQTRWLQCEKGFLGLAQSHSIDMGLNKRRHLLCQFRTTSQEVQSHTEFFAKGNPKEKGWQQKGDIHAKKGNTHRREVMI